MSGRIICSNHIKKVKRRYARLKYAGVPVTSHNHNNWLLLANGGMQNRVAKKDLNRFLRLFAETPEIIQPHNKAYAFCRLKSRQNLNALINSTHATRWEINGKLILKKLILKYNPKFYPESSIIVDFKGDAVNLIGYYTDFEPYQNESKLPPGIKIIEDFISQNEEAEISHFLLDNFRFERYRHRSMFQFGRIINFRGLTISDHEVETPAIIKTIQNRIETLTTEGKGF